MGRLERKTSLRQRAKQWAGGDFLARLRSASLGLLLGMVYKSSSSRFGRARLAALRLRKGPWLQVKGLPRPESQAGLSHGGDNCSLAIVLCSTTSITIRRHNTGTAAGGRKKTNAHINNRRLLNSLSVATCGNDICEGGDAKT